MTITVDLVTEAIRTGTGSPTTVTTTGAATSGIRGVVVALIHGTSATDHISAVTYGGVTMTRQIRTTDTATEAGAAELWFLGTRVPQGAQDCVYTSGATTNDIDCRVITLLGDADLAVIDTDSVSADTSGGTLANPSRTMQNSAKVGTSAMSFAAFYSGLTAQTSITAGANCSKVGTGELTGNFCSAVIRQTTAQTGTADFVIAATSAADDAAFAAMTVAELQSASPTVATVRFVGQTPTVTVVDPKTASPTVGTLRFVGQTPTVDTSNPITIEPTVGTLRLEGQTPTAQTQITPLLRPRPQWFVTPGVYRQSYAVRMVYDQITPYIYAEWPNTQLQPEAGLLRLEGQVPTVSTVSGETVAPTDGTLRFVGETPTVSFTAHEWTSPTAGTFQFVGQTPTVGYTQDASPSVGTVRLVGQTPTLNQTQSAAPTVGTLRFVGQTPNVGQTWSAAPTVAVLRFVGQTPLLLQTQDASPTVGAVLFVGQQPTLTQTTNAWATPITGEVRLIGQQPAVSWGDNFSVQPPAGVVRLVGQEPSIAQTWSVDPVVAVVRLDGQTPTVDVTDANEVYPDPGTLRIIGQTPEIVATGVEPAANEEQPTGGYAAANYAAIERNRRRRLKELEDEDEADRLEALLIAEGQLPPNPVIDDRIVVREYALQAEAFNRRTQRAIDYALRAQTNLAYQLAAREIAPQLEDEEYTLLLLLAAA